MLKVNKNEPGSVDANSGVNLSETNRGSLVIPVPRHDDITPRVAARRVVEGLVMDQLSRLA